MAEDSMWTFLDEEEAKSGGGAIIGLVEFGIGYKIFPSGKSQEETWFPFNPGDDASKKAAETACKAFVDKNGFDAKSSDGRPQVAVQFRVFKTEVLGREVTWKDDRFFTHPVWTPGYKEIVKPALKAAGVKSPGRYWGRIAFTKDPSGRTKVGPDGKDAPVMIEHLVEVYADKTAALAAVGSGAPTAAASAVSTAAAKIEGVPTGWDQATWDAIKPEIKADFTKRLNGDTSPGNQAKVKAALATDFGVTLADISAAVV